MCDVQMLTECVPSVSDSSSTVASVPRHRPPRAGPHLCVVFLFLSETEKVRVAVVYWYLNMRL